MPERAVKRTGGGKRPAAAELTQLKGVKPSRQNTRRAKLSKANGDPPASLTDTDALEVWWRVVPELKQFGLLNTVEIDALVCYCEAVVNHRRAVEEVRELGVTIVGGMGGLIKNPAVTVQFDAARVIRSFAVEFGLTPAARQNVAVPEGYLPGETAAAQADDFFSDVG